MSNLLLKNALMWEWSRDVSHAGKAINRSSISIDTSGYIQRISNSELIDESNFDKIFDLQGKLVLPGLSDAHIHVVLTGESQYFVDLKDCNSIEELISTVANHSLKHSDLEWIQGVNW